MKLKQYITEGEVKKKISAAVLMTDGEKFLAIHPTGWPNLLWDLPKGGIEPEEDPKQAAIREFYEETGQKINISHLRKVGKFPLLPRKDVILFTYSMDKLPSIESMRCLSVFGEKDTPEVNKWKHISFDEMKRYMRPEMYYMIRKAINK